jgi:hypothetical protein
MDLSGGLSNQTFRDLLQSLTGPGRVQVRLRKQRDRAGWPDGRRKFGTVSGAIVDVLSATDGELSVKAIRAEVERLVDGPVSRFSVSDFLLVRSKGLRPLFERTRYGHYRLLP